MDDSVDRDERHEMQPEPRGGGDPGGAAEAMGPLGQPVSEPAPRGTFVLLLLFLVVLVAAWVFAYLQVWDRGVS